MLLGSNEIRHVVLDDVLDAGIAGLLKADEWHAHRLVLRDLPDSHVDGCVGIEGQHLRVGVAPGHPAMTTGERLDADQVRQPGPVRLLPVG